MKKRIKNNGLTGEITSYLTGLTLIELLIAVALVVILVSMTLMVTNKSYSDADVKAAEGTIALLDSALQEYYDYYNYFPVYAAITDPALTSDEERHCAYLYRELNSVPDSRKIIERISDSRIKPRGNFFIYIDSWGMALNYIYVNDPANNNVMNFPLITSAGPDKNFETEADNITNKK
jgi:type II secretory pathway pseudopilin PulG